METILAIITIAILCVMFGVLGVYARMGANDDILAQQFQSDFLLTKKLMSSCTKKDAMKLIDAFYDRWAGLAPEWVICDHVMQLRHYLDNEHRTIIDIIYTTSKN